METSDCGVCGGRCIRSSLPTPWTEHRRMPATPQSYINRLPDHPIHYITHPDTNHPET